MKELKVISLYFFLIVNLFSGLHVEAKSIVSGDIVEGQAYQPNFLKQKGHYEKNANGTSAYADAAGTRPIDGSGGAPTLSCTRTTSSPIDGDGSLLITKDAANRQGQGCTIQFTIDSAYKAKVLQIEFDYLVASGTFTAGSSSADSDLIVYIYDVTNSTLIEPSSIKLLSNSSTISDHFVANFQTSATGTTYNLILHQATTSASAYTVKADNFEVKPSKYIYGTPITDWVSYTPTFGAGFGTVSTSSFYSRRVGDSLQVKGKWTNGTVAGSAATITVGYAGSNANVTIDTSKVSTNGIIGTAQTSLTSTTQFGVYPIAPTSNGTAISFTVQNSTTAFGSGAQNGNIIAASASQNSVEFSVPIQGWSSSVQVSDGYDGRLIAAHAHKNGTDQTGVNPNSSFVKITFPSVASSGGGFDKTSSFDTTNSKFTAPSSGLYRVTGYATVTATNVLNNDYGLALYKNGSIFKVLVEKTQGATTILSVGGATTIDLIAGDYLELYFYGLGNNSASTLTISGGASSTYFIIEKLQAPTTISATEEVLFVGKNSASTSIATTGTYIPFTSQKDTHGAWSTDTFTCPIYGDYEVIAGLHGSSASNYFYAQVEKGGVNHSRILQNESRGDRLASGSTIVENCNAGTTIKLNAFSDTASQNLNSSAVLNYIMIKRIK